MASHFYDMLYKPLNEDLDEIRLISLLPASKPRDGLDEGGGNDRIHCRMDTVSLQDFAENYRKFGSSSSSLTRDQLASWVRSNMSGNTSEDQQSRTQVPPSTDSYRFQWGDFATLSYNWGVHAGVKEIVVNGVNKQVTKNLFEALEIFHTFGWFSKGYRLWVDAMCINQADDVERSSQVGKMRDIFAGSWTTVAFLGGEADRSGDAIGLLKDLARIETQHKGTELRDILQDDPGYFGVGKWLALQHFLQRAYWSRLWVVQEVALAPMNMLMFCGKDSITWSEVQKAIGSIHGSNWYVKDVCLEHDRRILRARKEYSGQVSAIWDADNLHHINKDLTRIAEKESRGKEGLHFDDLLDMASATTSFLSLDKVYGLLAIMEPSISEQVVVDYRLQPSVLFSRVAQLFIKHTKSLLILRSGTPWSQSSCPSWAPDWTCEGRIREKLLPVLRYAADGGRSAEYTFSADGRLLTAKGIIVDRIEGLGPLQSIKDTMRQPKIAFNSAYGSNASTRDALHRAIVGDRDGHMADLRAPVGGPLPLLYLPTDQRSAMTEFKQRGWGEFAIQGDRYEEWSGWRTSNDDLELGRFGRLGDMFTDTIPADANCETLWHAFLRFRNMSSGRTFVTTSGGRFGWVLENQRDADGTLQAQRGDLFCVLFGCEVPLVIRRCDNNYEILGDGYIQGFMEGEALQAVEDGKLSAEELTFQ